jgi:hypothetical protein
MTMLTFTAGDDVQLDVTATADLTGSVVYWTLKRAITDPDADALIEASTTNGDIALSGFTATVTLAAALTAPLPTNSSLVWALQVRDNASKVYTLAQGTVLALPPVLRSVP